METRSTFIYLKQHYEFFKATGHKVHYTKNQIVIRDDDPHSYVYFIEKGVIKLSFMPRVHDERIVGFMLPGMNFAQNRSFFEADGGGLDYIASNDVSLLRVRREDFLAAIKTDPAMSDEYVQQLLRNQVFLLERSVYMGESNVYYRLARWLLLMEKYYSRPTSGGQTIIPELTQATIGSFIHASRESISQALAKLVRDGVISIQRKHVTIHSSEALRSLL